MLAESRVVTAPGRFAALVDCDQSREGGHGEVIRHTHPIGCHHSAGCAVRPARVVSGFDWRVNVYFSEAILRSPP
jgi:hypothetical protein